MRWLRWLLAAAVVLVFPTRVGAEPYSDPNGRYAIDFPQGWTVSPDPAFPQIMVATPPKGSLVAAATQQNIKVVAADFALGMTLERYVEGSLIQYKDIWKVRERRAVDLPAGQAQRLLLDQDLSAMDARLKGQRTSLLKVFLGDGEHVFVITCASAPGAFAKVLPTYEAVVKSFKILPPAPAGTLRKLEAPGFGLTFPASWSGSSGQMGLAAIVTRRVGQDKGSLMVSYDAENDAEAMLAASKRNHADGKLGKITAEGEATIGGRKAHKLAFSDPEELYSYWVEYYVPADRGHYHVRVTFDGEDRPPPADLLAELDQMLASWVWK